MFIGLHLENYKSFKKVDIDLKKNKLPKKMIAIYGENGSGKSNIVSAFTGLSQSLDTVTNQANLAKLQKQIADSSDENATQVTPKNVWLQLLSSGNVTNTYLPRIFADAGMIGSTDPITLQYDFEINGSTGYYRLVFNRNGRGVYLAEESLYYLIKRSSGTLFKITGDAEGKMTLQWSPSLFKKGTMLDLVENETQRLWGKNSFLAVFNSIQSDNNRQYLRDNVSMNFLRVLERFNRVAFRDDDSGSVNGFRLLLRNMMHGQIPDTDESQRVLKITERALNKYFVPLYSDTYQLFYRTQGKNQDVVDYELFEKKRIGGEVIEVPFRLESNGTKRLLNLFPLFLNAVHGETVIIDEIDQGIHDLLVDRLVDSLEEDIQGQLIFTTHDTQVMKELEPSAVYVIQSDVSGNKQVVSLSKNGKANIAAHNNIQKMYLNGYFAGIPYADDVDFGDILSDLQVPTDGE